jgi:hypothetical protein
VILGTAALAVSINCLTLVAIYKYSIGCTSRFAMLLGAN